MAVVALLANVGLSLVLMASLKHTGLALANSLAAMVNVSLLLIWLRRKMGTIDWAGIIKSFIQIAAASAVMGWVSSWIAGRESWATPGLWGEKVIILAVAIGAGLLTYIAISHVLRNRELSFLVEMVWKKREQLSFGGEAD